MNVRIGLLLVAVGLSAFLIGQGQKVVARHEHALAFADSVKKSAPDVPSHLFATGQHGSVFVATPFKPIRAHYHASHEETIVILRGTGRMRLGDAEREVKTGDLIFVPKGVVHDFRPSGEDAVAVSCFAPIFDGKDRVFVDGPSD